MDTNKISVKKFIEDFKAKKIVNTKIKPDAVEAYIKETLNIKSYIPYQNKCEIVRTIIENNMNVVNGYKVVNSTTQFLSFIIAMLVAYTDLEIQDPFEAFDMLSDADLLNSIIECFKSEYDQCDVLLKMTLADELQTNATPAIIAEFLNKIGSGLAEFSSIAQEKLGDFDVAKLLSSENISGENIELIKQLLNK